MKKNISTALYLMILALVMEATLAAQQPSQSTPSDQTAEQASDADANQLREDIRSQRKKIVASNMPLSEAEAAKFWPVYDQYIAATIKVNDVRYALLKEYAQNYQNMTDAQADDFIQRWLALDNDDTNLRLQYVPEFQKVISHKKTGFVFSSGSEGRHADEPPTRRESPLGQAVADS